MAQNAAKTEIANDVVRMPLTTVIDNAPVGAILHDARIAAGQDLPHVSERLRIRRVYIEAIEESRLADLPGLPYAIGFVRAYANHLGLDTQKLVEKFKQEASDLEGKTQLVLPEPIAVGRTPTGPVVFLSLLLLACAYGGWLYVSNKDAAQIDLIPPLPDSIAQLINPDAAAPEPNAAEETAPTPEPERVTVQVEAQPPTEAAPVLEKLSEPASEPTTGAPAAAEAPQTAAPQTATPESPAPVEAAPEAVAPDETATETTTSEPAAQEIATEATGPERTAPSEPAAAVVTAAPEIARQPAEEEPVVEDTADSAQTLSEVEPSAALARAEPTPAVEPNRALETDPAASAAPVLETAAPVVYGAENADSRVVIVARGPVWVEVTGADGQVLLTRLLNDGDRFRTPNTPGLTLVTGNAGGLEFLVDGVAAPDIGPAGAVRRDVSLDPEALLRGPDPATQ
ncbi:MAG: DUF4115 domain-containing protein [Alphaproteobacteria bacterium]|nr:DUF4115 domain-containing protein [Alphaproteobacteria bacterium]